MVLLLGSLAGILLTSSALRNGRKVVVEIDKRSVEARLRWKDNLTALAPQSTTLTNNPMFSDLSEAELVDEIELRLYGYFVNSLPDKEADPKQAAGIERLKARYDELQRFVSERENAYNLEFGVSNLKSTVFVNALIVIDLWPLLLICTLAAVSAITLRQRAYEIILSNMIRDSGGRQERAIESAFTGFLAGDLRPAVLSGERILIYMPSLILLPEPLITFGLLIAVLYFSVGLPATEMPSIFRLNSTVFGYHTILIAAGGILGIVLLRTRSFYKSMIEAATGSKVLSWVGFHSRKWTRLVKSPYTSRRKQRAVYVLSTIALTSLFLPWLGNWRLSGFQLFLPQRPVAQNTTVAFYKIDPFVMREMRIQLAIALVFVMIMLLTTMGKHYRIARSLRRLSHYLSFLVSAMILNFIVYLLLLAYNAQRTVVNDMFDMIFGPGGSIVNISIPRGIPLVLQYPMYGFFVFAASLTALCTLAIVAGSTQPDEQQVALLYAGSAKTT